MGLDGKICFKNTLPTLPATLAIAMLWEDESKIGLKLF